METSDLEENNKDIGQGNGSKNIDFSISYINLEAASGNGKSGLWMMPYNMALDL